VAKVASAKLSKTLFRTEEMAYLSGMCKEKYSRIFRTDRASLRLPNIWWVTWLENSQIESKFKGDRMARNSVDLEETLKILYRKNTRIAGKEREFSRNVIM
jgi:hypothetical protein